MQLVRVRGFKIGPAIRGVVAPYQTQPFDIQRLMILATDFQRRFYRGGNKRSAACADPSDYCYVQKMSDTDETTDNR